MTSPETDHIVTCNFAKRTSLQAMSTTALRSHFFVMKRCATEPSDLTTLDIFLYDRSDNYLKIDVNDVPKQERRTFAALVAYTLYAGERSETRIRQCV